MLPAPGVRLDDFGGHGRVSNPGQPALMACDASTGRVYPVASLPLHEHTPGMVCFDERNQIYYVLGTRLAGGGDEFKQNTHLIGINVLSGGVTLDVPFTHRVLSMRYDNVNASLLMVVMHSGRQFDAVSAVFVPHIWTVVQHDGPNHLELCLIQEEAPPNELSGHSVPLFDERSLIRVNTRDGSTERVGLAVLPPEEQLSLAGAADLSICSQVRDSGWHHVHGLYSNKMALITSDCGKMRSLSNNMAVTTSDCVPAGLRVGLQPEHHGRSADLPRGLRHRLGRLRLLRHPYRRLRRLRR